MPKTAADIYELFNCKLPGWGLQAIPELTEEEREKTGVEKFTPASSSILTSPEGEKIVVSFSNTTVTGTERAKPQIRIFTEGIISAFQYAKIKGLRFFAFVVCRTDPATLKLSSGLIPDDYLVSLESSFDQCSSGRVDIRSMYDAMELHSTKDYLRLSAEDHSCSSIEQASFIRISDASTPVIVDGLLRYMTYFDNRPYMRSVKEGMKVVCQPSALFEKSADSDSRYPWNLLVFGAPGTGKSHLLDQKLNELREELGDEQVVADRITFYADYSYQQFVGGYMPIPKSDVPESIEATDGLHTFTGKITGQRISYEFVPGPFGVLLAKALASKIRCEDKRYVLIIEELNRANAAGIFGDMFQLLDRDQGVSNYFASVSDSFAEYLHRVISSEIKASNPAEAERLSAEGLKRIKLPDNLYLWSTMNSADQGVFPVDSAFKRRWSFLYKDINAVAPEAANRPFLHLPCCTDSGDVHGERYDWNTLRKAINWMILKTGFEEDRCVGYWFFTEEEMSAMEAHTSCVIRAFQGDSGAAAELETLPNPLVDKLLSYLRQDVFRSNPTQFFKEECKTLSAIRLAVNHLEINGRKPVSLGGDVTWLTKEAFEAVPSPLHAAAEGEEES